MLHFELGYVVPFLVLLFPSDLSSIVYLSPFFSVFFFFFVLLLPLFPALLER